MGRENRLILLSVLVCIELGVLVSEAIVYPSVHWSFQNPLFEKGHYRLNVLPGSKLNIICPHVAVSLVERQDTDTGFNCENFWRVDFNSYQTCNVSENSIPQNKIFLSCDDPRQMQFETIEFLPSNTDPPRRFKKGKVYYFISTSTGSCDSLKGRRDGHCLTEKMKMQIYVCTGPEDTNCTDKKPATKPPQVAVETFITNTTSAASTVRLETTKLSSSKQPSPPQTNSTETYILSPQPSFCGHPTLGDQPPAEASKKEKDSSHSTNGSTTLGALMEIFQLISYVANVYSFCWKRILVFFSRKRIQSSKQGGKSGPSSTPTPV